MLRNPLMLLYRLWRRSSLRAKLVVPILALMALSVLASTVFFAVVTTNTQQELLAREIGMDMDRVEQSLRSRAETVMTAARMLAQDAEVAEALQGESTEALAILNRRVLVVRDRLQLDLVQVFDQRGEMRSNVLMSSLYRQSSLLDLLDQEGPVIRVVEGRLLLLARTRLASVLAHTAPRGTVVTGVDLTSELQRIEAEYRLLSHLRLYAQGTRVGYATTAAVGATESFLARRAITIGQSAADLEVTRPTTDIREITQAGQLVMVISNVLTTLVLFAVALAVTGLLVKPLHRLAMASQRLSNGDLSLEEVRPLQLLAPPSTQDEIDLLAHSFAHMVGELGSLYNDLESKVEARTKALALAEERYRRLFEEDLAGVFIADGEGHILTCNPAFARIFGFASVPDALQADLASLFPDAASWQRFVALLKHSGRVENYETALRTSNGQPVHVIENVIAARDAQGEILEIKGYLFDNSERIKLEEQLRQSQKMEAVGRLAGGVAHDFNNLLTVILGYGQMVMDTLQVACGGVVDTEAMGKDVEVITKAGERAATLTRQLLAFSRKQVMQPKVVALNEIVAGMEKMLRRVIGEDVALETQLCSDEGYINSDPSQVEQVIMNLVVNARDAMPRGGKLAIETQNVVLSASDIGEAEAQPGPYVMLAVCDTGIGMDAETARLIFEPFFTTKQMGTGLGLATVYGIVKQSSGHIAVHSQVGQGTTMCVYLPRVDAPSAVESSPAERRQACRGTGLVLLVEDEKMVRELASEVLRRQGYTVVEAENGAAAWALLQERALIPDLLVTDIVMPQLDGHGLAQRMLEKQPNLRILFMSGYAEGVHGGQRSFNHGSSFIQKPFAPDAFALKVQEVMHGPVSGVGDKSHHSAPE